MPLYPVPAPLVLFLSIVLAGVRLKRCHFSHGERTEHILRVRSLRSREPMGTATPGGLSSWFGIYVGYFRRPNPYMRHPTKLSYDNSNTLTPL